MSTLAATNLKNPSSGSNNIVLSADGSTTIPTISATTITGTSVRGSITSGTSVASTSGVSIDFTGIPSWAKRITVMFNGVSVSGTSLMLLRIGSSGGIEATGYSAGSAGGSSAGQFATSLTEFPLNTSAAAVATDLLSGAVVLTNVNSNTWVLHGSTYRGPSYGVGAFCGGSKTLSGTLDRVRITTVNGTDNFDAGSINILYEG